mgnify:CR=1 FL=1
MRVIVIGACAAMLTALVSCTTIQVVEKEVPKLPPKELVSFCDIERPPARDIFVSAVPELQMQMALDYSAALLVNLNVCNARIDSYLTWRQKQEVLYKTNEGQSNATQSNP